MWIVFFALSVTAEVAPEAPVCDANGKKCDETSAPDLMLMQKGVKKHLPRLMLVMMMIRAFMITCTSFAMPKAAPR
jgi:hypothetical protein